MDSSGNVFVTGFLQSTTNMNIDIATVAYSGAGTPLWTNRYDGGPGDLAQAVAVDGSGNVFVMGGSGGDYVTIKYSTSVPRAPSPIPLDFQQAGDQLVLSWTNPVFSLQSAPLISATFTNVPGATSPYTNSFTEPEQYFRLAAP